MSLKTIAAALAFGALILVGACSDGDATANASADAVAKTIPLTITSANGPHKFVVETAKTESEQQRGLMYRTNLTKDGGMLFAPYPPGGGAPRAAAFWMKNTPTPLDILFIRADGTIATIAENTVPFSETQIPSGEPIAAVLELVGGRTGDLGISEGDKVTWPGHGG